MGLRVSVRVESTISPIALWFVNFAVAILAQSGRIRPLSISELTGAATESVKASGFRLSPE